MKRKEKKQETLKRIVDVSLHLFSEKGYEQTSVAEIAETAGIGKGTFFYYFPSKEDLLMMLQETLFAEEINNTDDNDGPYAPRILALVKKMGDSMSENHAVVRATLQRCLTTAQLDESRNAMLSKIQSMVPIFEKGQQTGEFTTAISPAVMAHTAIQIYLGALVSWSTEVQAVKLSDQLTTSFQVFLNGIVKK